MLIMTVQRRHISWQAGGAGSLMLRQINCLIGFSAGKRFESAKMSAQTLGPENTPSPTLWEDQISDLRCSLCKLLYALNKTEKT